MKNFARVLCLALVAVMLCATLASCAPAKEPDDALKALKDNGYIALKDELVVKALGAKALVSGTKVEKNDAGEVTMDAVFIYYFKDADTAKSSFDKIKAEIEKLKAAEEEKDGAKVDFTIKQSGAMIYGGTAAAIKAAK